MLFEPADSQDYFQESLSSFVRKWIDRSLLVYGACLVKVDTKGLVLCMIYKSVGEGIF